MGYQYSYHDSTDIKGALLDKYESIAKSEEKIILEYFKLHPGQSFAPQHLMKLLHNRPLTNIRRAFTNLQKQGKLVKEQNKVIGLYGRKTHVWCLHYSESKQSSLLEAFS